MKLSFSAAQKYLKCPRLYQLYYLLGVRQANRGSALLFGSAIDEALNGLLNDPERSLSRALESFKATWTSQDINGSNELLESSEKVIYYNQDFDVDVLTDEDIFIIFNKLKNLGYEFDHTNLDKIHDELCKAKRDKTFSENERIIFNLMSWYSMLRKGEMILRAYYEEVLPKIKKVLDVQKYFSIDNGEGDEVIGYMDLRCVWEDNRVIKFDHKTSSKKYELNSVKESEQLATYTVGFDYEESTAGFIVFEKNIRKKDPRVRIQVIIDEIPTSLQEKVLDQYNEVCYNLKNEKFEQNLNSCVDDRGFRCEYYGVCHGSGDMAGLIKVKK